MKILTAKTLTHQQQENIFHLWNNEYPSQLVFLSINDLGNYLRALSHPTHFLAMDEAGKIAGWAFTFTRENERWFAIIVDGHYQRRGIGKQLLNQLKENEKTLNGWMTDHDDYTKADGTSYLSPQNFYRKNGFDVCSAERLETEKLSAVKISWKAD